MTDDATDRPGKAAKEKKGSGKKQRAKDAVVEVDEVQEMPVEEPAPDEEPAPVEESTADLAPAPAVPEPTPEPRPFEEPVAERQPSALSPRRFIAIAAVFLLVAGLVLMAVLWWQADDRADDLASDRDDRQEASLVASDFIRTLLSINTTNPTAGFEHLRSLATAEYREKLKPPEDAPTTSAPSSEVSMSADVLQVYIVDASGNEAHAVCLVSLSIASGDEAVPLGQRYIEVDLKREEGAWKVNQVPAFGDRRESGTPVPTTPGATTTVPTDTTVPETSPGG